MQDLEFFYTSTYCTFLHSVGDFQDDPDQKGLTDSRSTGQINFRLNLSLKPMKDNLFNEAFINS